MTFLADANVICETTKTQRVECVCQWLRTHDGEIVIDAVVLGEIWEGIMSLPDGRKKRNLEAWFTELRQTVVCLPWTDDTAVVWGELRQDVRRRGFSIGINDTMIAATAKLHGLTVATRNVDDFRRCGVVVVDPFQQ